MVRVKRLPIAPHIEDEAAAWVARQDTGALDPAAEAEFRSWLATSPAHEDAFNRYSGLWSEFDGLASAPRKPAPANDGAPWLGRRAIAASAGLLLLVGVTVSTIHLTASPQLETAIGEQRTVTLKDGSRITLNTNTGLSTDLGETSRRISLDRGEALFEVAHDPSRPFIVETRFGSVRAVGTKFVVRIDDAQGLSVVVTEGRVVVTRSKSRPAVRENLQTPVKAGQELETANGRIETLPSQELSRELAWRQGDVVFEGETLAQAAAEMQRYTTTRIIVDPSVAKYSVGGYFRTNDVDGFVTTVEDLFPVKAQKSGNTIRITARG
jgi:transmembrane sensor